MKTIVLSLVLAVLFLNGTKAQVVQNVDAVKFNQLISSEDAILLDVRTPQEYSRGHIKGSTLIDISDPGFTSKVAMLQKDKTILIYCLSGSRSYAAANYMSQNGFKKIYNLQQPGLMAWNRQGYPLEQSAQTVASTATKYTPQSFSKILAENKVVLVDFNAAWCAPCKAMSPVIDKVSADFKGKARVEKVDVEANKEITTAYQVQSVPGFVIFKNGKKVWSHNGTISYNDLTVELKKYL
ncbi:MAG: thioredoxin domain-containing protein [Prolixibacteraceae bacterium]